MSVTLNASYTNRRPSLDLVMHQRVRRLVIVVALGLTLGLGAMVATGGGRAALWSALTWLRGRATVETRVAELVEPTQRIRERCEAAGLSFPPSELALVAFKDTKLLNVLGRSGGSWGVIVAFPILGASGVSGPKLAEGDLQVPEGVYRIESLNPNSMFHLALRVSYPNDFDRAKAALDGRANLGGDIMIHGGSASIGCLAMGDPAIEELFVLVARTGPERTRVIIAPTESVSPDTAAERAPNWLPELYQSLRSELAELSE